MKRNKIVRKCAMCGREFTPSNYTVHIQKYCINPECVRTRKRARQNEWRKKMRGEDPEWRGKAIQIIDKSRKRRQEREMNAAEKSVQEEVSKIREASGTKAMLAGLSMIVGKIKDCDELIAYLAKLEIKGRKALKRYSRSHQAKQPAL